MTTTQDTPTTLTASGRSSGSRTRQVLLAEDDAVQRIVFTRVLEGAGFEVIAAENGVQAIELSRVHRPDLMILDAIMPQMGGFEAIAAIRAQPGLATTPAIVVSGLDDIQSRLDAFAIGADDFVTKPTNSDELVARVRAQLRMVEAWNGRVDRMVGGLRAIRRHISDTERLVSPIEAARSLVQRFPSGLGCSTMATIESGGEMSWANEPFYAEDLIGIDLAAEPTPDGSAIVEISDRGLCPLCGSASGGSIIVADAGSWSSGRAILVVGCLARPLDDLHLLVEEVADACTIVLSERLRDWESDFELAKWLDRVVDAKAFSIVFQPIVDMRSGRVVAQESLVRFDDGTSPAQVFQAATTLDRRVPLELALVESALAQAVALPTGVRIHVNVSPLTARTSELADLVANTSRRVVLEVTENALFSSANADALRDSMPTSCLLAADDVGTGYAGLSQLLEYRPDILKIDRAVVTGIDQDPARQALVAGLVEFARATDSQVVGEGIERLEEWQALLRLGVEFGQGYYFGRPAPLRTASSLVSVSQPEQERSGRRNIRQLVGR